jgi:glycerol kinase
VGGDQLLRHRLAGHAERPHRHELASSGGQDRFRSKTGLPLATDFSGTKARWILDHVPGARAATEQGELLFGNASTPS